MRDRETIAHLSADVLEVTGRGLRATRVEHDELGAKRGALVRRVDESPLTVATVRWRRRQAPRLIAHAVATEANHLRERAPRSDAEARRARARRVDGLQRHVRERLRSLVAVLVPGFDDGALLAAGFVDVPTHLVGLAA